MLNQSPYPRLRPLAGVRLLLVEDDEDCRGALRVLLEYNGAEVECVGSAAAGRAALAERRPHVVISDLSMPGEDGFSFVASLRRLLPEDGGHTPVVAFSAMPPFDARARAEEVGFQAFLRKPLDVLLIVSTVKRLLPPSLAP